MMKYFGIHDHTWEQQNKSYFLNFDQVKLFCVKARVGPYQQNQQQTLVQVNLHEIENLLYPNKLFTQTNLKFFSPKKPQKNN